MRETANHAMAVHMRPMPGRIVAIPVPDPDEQPPTDRIIGAPPVRMAIVLDMGTLGEVNSESYIFGSPSGLEVGCRVAYEDNMYSVRRIDGFLYLTLQSIVAWEPA